MLIDVGNRFSLLEDNFEEGQKEGQKHMVYSDHDMISISIMIVVEFHCGLFKLFESLRLYFLNRHKLNPNCK